MTARPKHTPEPWIVIYERETVSVAGSEDVARDMQLECNRATDDSLEVLAFPLSHVLACVNACAGLNPEAIPALIAATEYAARLLASYDPLGVAEGDVLYDLRAALAAVRGEK